MKRNFVYYLSPSILTGILSIFVIIPVSTYYLEPRDFGIVAIITVFSGLVVPLSSTGYGWVLSSNYYKISPKEQGALVGNLLVVGLLLRAFWVLIFGVLGGLFLHRLIKCYESDFLLYFWIFLIAEWFNYGWGLAGYVIMLQKKGKAHAFLDMIKILSRVFILIICLAILHLKTISLALGYLGAAIAGFLFSVVYLRKYISLSIKFRWIKEIIRRGMPTIPLSLFEIISNSIGRLFIERWIGLSQLGIYSHSLDYRKAFMLPHRAFLKSYSPEVLEIFSGKSDKGIGFVKDVLKKWFGFLLFTGGIIVLFAKEAISILTHSKFVAAAPLVSLWFVLILIYTFSIPYSNFLFAHKKTKFLFYSELISGVVSWGIIAFLIKFFGIIGATISILIYFFILHFSKKVYALKLGCENIERNYFTLAVVILVSLIYIISSFSIAFPVKIMILLVLALFAFKYYDLSSIAIFLKKC